MDFLYFRRSEDPRPTWTVLIHNGSCLEVIALLREVITSNTHSYFICLYRPQQWWITPGRCLHQFCLYMLFVLFSCYYYCYFVSGAVPMATSSVAEPTIFDPAHSYLRTSSRILSSCSSRFRRNSPCHNCQVCVLTTNDWHKGLSFSEEEGQPSEISHEPSLCVNFYCGALFLISKKKIVTTNDWGLPNNP